MATNFNDLESQRFGDDLRRAAGFKPITESELEQAYARYKPVGVKIGRVKGKSEAQLYKLATTDVINWWKHTKNQEAKQKAEQKAAAARQQAEQKAAAAKAAQAAKKAQQRAQAATQAAQARQARARASSGETTMPDTAMGGKGTGPTDLPSILAPSYMRQQLERSGFANSNPPSYALANKEAFDRWLSRATDYRNRHRSVAVLSPVRSRTRRAPRVVTYARRPIATNRAPVIR